jgi:hypothetical protein
MIVKDGRNETRFNLNIESDVELEERRSELWC